MRVLVVNAGSSSVKLRVLGDDDALLASRDLPGGHVTAGQPRDLARAISEDAELGAVDAVGHRIVHGGTDYTEAVLVDAGVVGRLGDLAELAPLHQPAALAALAAVTAALPDVPAVACFDTAFHASLPEAAATYALPATWRKRWPLRRFGFHGLSHGYVSRRAPELLGRGAVDLRIVSCHLGAGASLAAIEGGLSVDTTMGFTPLEGLVMATRSGSVDPGLVLWLLQRGEMSADELADGLEKESGLLGLGGHGDMRDLLTAEAKGDGAARLAVSVYLHRLRAGIAAMAASMGGLDALVFTGGVGENSATIRARVASGLGFLGIEVDPRKNEAGRRDREIDAPGARVRTLVIDAREDLEIARQTREVVGQWAGALIPAGGGRETRHSNDGEHGDE